MAGFGSELRIKKKSYYNKGKKTKKIGERWCKENCNGVLYRKIGKKHKKKTNFVSAHTKYLLLLFCRLNIISVFFFLFKFHL